MDDDEFSGDHLPSSEARLAWRDRRLEPVLRQLDRRIAQVDSLRAELEQLHGQQVPPQGSVVIDAESLARLRERAEAYDTVMATKSMRLLSVPRSIYGRLLRFRKRGA